MRCIWDVKRAVVRSLETTQHHLIVHKDEIRQFFAEGNGRFGPMADVFSLISMLVELTADQAAYTRVALYDEYFCAHVFTA